MQLNPVRCSSTEDPKQLTRNVFCEHYGTCLDYAIEKDWEGFTCGRCHAFKNESMAPEQRAREAQRCMALLHFIEYPYLSVRVSRRDFQVGKKRQKESVCFF